MSRIIFLLLFLPSSLWAQQAYRADLSLQLIGLGVGVQYELAFSERQSLAANILFDHQEVFPYSIFLGSMLQVHYRYCFCGQQPQKGIQSGVLLSVFAEQAFKRILEREKIDTDYSRTGLGLQAGYRLLPGRKKRFSFTVLVGAKYVIPNLRLPAWYPLDNRPSKVRGFTPQVSVGLGWRIQASQDE